MNKFPKNFDGWNEIKKAIHLDESTKFYHAREVWWCSLGINVGFEQDGTGDEYRRPVLILKGLSRQTCLVIPLTASTHIHRLRQSVGLVGGQEAKALLSQMRVIDTKRFVRKIGYIKHDAFELIRRAVKDML